MFRYSSNFAKKGRDWKTWQRQIRETRDRSSGEKKRWKNRCEIISRNGNSTKGNCNKNKWTGKEFVAKWDLCSTFQLFGLVKKIIMDRKRSEEAVFSTDFSRARPNSPGSIYETNGAVQRRARGPVDELEWKWQGTRSCVTKSGISRKRARRRPREKHVAQSTNRGMKTANTVNWSLLAEEHA